MTHIEQLVARQLEYWELRGRREREDRLRNGAGPPPNGPSLLVSREQDSGGTRLARLVGERLGWHVYDREIVEEIAQRAHVRQQLVESVDEQVRSRWSEWWQKPGPDHLAPREYLAELREVIFALGHHGHVVIVGRGAAYLLPRESALRLRVIAPLDLRAQRRARTHDLPLDEARQYVQRIDVNRRLFLRGAFGVDPDNPLNYDLVINTGILSLDVAVEIVLAALAHHLGIQPGAAPCHP